ncbi:hypothetical protein BGZ76_005707, partial [Entomortierella beljakovae]
MAPTEISRTASAAARTPPPSKKLKADLGPSITFIPKSLTSESIPKTTEKRSSRKGRTARKRLAKRKKCEENDT